MSALKAEVLAVMPGAEVVEVSASVVRVPGVCDIVALDDGRYEVGHCKAETLNEALDRFVASEEDTARRAMRRARLVHGLRFCHPVAVIVVLRGPDVLLLERPNGGGWTLPGGKLIEGERLVEGARRELREETGLDCEALVQLLAFDGVPVTSGGRQYAVTAFVGTVVAADVRLSSEHVAWRWVAPAVALRDMVLAADSTRAILELL